MDGRTDRTLDRVRQEGDESKKRASLEHKMQHTRSTFRTITETDLAMRIVSTGSRTLKEHSRGWMARTETMNAITEKRGNKKTAEVQNTCGQLRRGDAKMTPGAAMRPPKPTPVGGSTPGAVTWWTSCCISRVGRTRRVQSEANKYRRQKSEYCRC